MKILSKNFIRQNKIISFKKDNYSSCYSKSPLHSQKKNKRLFSNKKQYKLKIQKSIKKFFYSEPGTIFQMYKQIDMSAIWQHLIKASVLYLLS